MGLEIMPAKRYSQRWCNISGDNS